MSENILNETICLKQYISEKEYKEISELENLCFSQDKTNLKLELDYKLTMGKNSEVGLKEINEFLYYIQGTLVSYLAISSYGDCTVGEMNGMTHPEWRRKGIFKKLFSLAMEQCKKRNFDQVLLLSDGKSSSGIEFINSVNGIYDFSEYRMKLNHATSSESKTSIILRQLEKEKDTTELTNIFEEVKYEIEANGNPIGKIRVDYSDNSAFICGFEISPDFRGKGYGKATLKEVLKLLQEKNIQNIELDVECKNNTALNLYKSLGFEEQSVMGYYTH